MFFVFVQVLFGNLCNNFFAQYKATPNCSLVCSPVSGPPPASDFDFFSDFGHYS